MCADVVLCLLDVVIQWCAQGDLLAVAGMERSTLPPDPSAPPPVRNAIVKFYNVRGEHIYTLDTPAQVHTHKTHTCHSGDITFPVVSDKK